jgi:hypothetical protein
MKRILTAVSIMLLMWVVAAQAQSSTPKPTPELKQEDVWVGDWLFSGTGKDSPTGPEYKVDWQMHSHWILGGFFLESDSTWKGNGQEAKWLEIGSYDPVKKTHIVSGFASDGTTWTLTATFDSTTCVENMTVTGPDGKVSTCRNSWHFTTDGMAISGTEECEQDGVRWTGFTVKGTKSKTAH